MSSAAVVIGALRVKMTGTVSGEVTLLLAHLYESSENYCYPFDGGWRHTSKFYVKALLSCTETGLVFACCLSWDRVNS